MILLSRSALDCYDVCKQKYYLQYLHDGHGIVETTADIDLSVGIAVHEFFETIFKANLGKLYDHSQDLCDRAIDIALNKFKELTEDKTLKLKAFEGSDPKDVIKEESANIEAICYTYWINKFPNHHETYEFLDIEQEEFLYLFSIEIKGVETPVYYMAKADGTWRNRVGNHLEVLSNKCISSYMPITARDYQQSSQNVSELYCLNNRLKKIRNELLTVGREPQNPTEEYVRECINKNIEAKANTILYNHLIKGQRREEPYKSGNYHRNSFLIRPYNYNIIQKNPFSSYSSASISGTNYDNYKIAMGSGRPPKGWARVNIWQDVGIRNFVDALKEGLVQPEEGNYLDKITIDSQAEPIFKTDYKINIWFERLIYKLKNDILPKYIDLLSGDTSAQIIYDTDTTRCYDFYGKDCPYIAFCHEDANIDEYLDLNIVKIRRPHHKPEEEQFIKKGYLENET